MSHEMDLSLLDRQEILEVIFPVVYSPSIQNDHFTSSSSNAKVYSTEVEKDINVTSGFWVSGKESPSILYFHGNGETVNGHEWIAPFYNQCKKVFSEITNAAHEIITRQNKADLTIEFINGSTLQFLSTDNYNTIRGFSFNYMVVDEAAYVREEAINEAVLPTLSALGKKCLIISTPKSKNWFYSAYLKGVDQVGDYISFRGISTDNPHISQTFIDEQRKSLPSEIFKQEYMAEFSEATNDVFSNLDNVCILDGWRHPGRDGLPSPWPAWLRAPSSTGRPFISASCSPSITG